MRKVIFSLIVSIKRVDGQSIFNPTPDIIILEGDVLIVLGERDQVNALERTMHKS